MLAQANQRQTRQFSNQNYFRFFVHGIVSIDSSSPKRNRIEQNALKTNKFLHEKNMLSKEKSQNKWMLRIEMIEINDEIQIKKSVHEEKIKFEMKFLDDLPVTANATIS